MDHSLEFEDFIRQNKFDPKLAAPLLLDVKEVLDKIGVNFFLAFGTLLGAYRDGALIPHDTDLDIGVIKDSKSAIERAKNQGEFSKKGILFFRKREFSLTRNGQYLDIYVFENKGDFFQTGCKQFRLSSDELPFGEIEFLNHKFLAPNNIPNYLERRYGKDWNVPIKNKHATR